jgi:hypothetical protein
MSARIEDFLIELSQDPYRTARFKANPELELVGQGWNPDQVKVLISGDAEVWDKTLHMAAKKNNGGAKKNNGGGGKKPKPKTKKK